jgi:hypothetical protein
LEGGNFLVSSIMLVMVFFSSAIYYLQYDVLLSSLLYRSLWLKQAQLRAKSRIPPWGREVKEDFRPGKGNA